MKMSTWYGCHRTQRENKQRLRWNYAVILVCTYTTIGWIIHPMILLSVNYSPNDSGQTASYPSVTHMTKWVNDGRHIFQHRQVDFWDTFYGKLKQKTNDILWWNGWRSIDNWCTEIIALLLMRRKNTKSQAMQCNGMQEVQLRLDKMEVAFQEAVELRWEKMRM